MIKKRIQEPTIILSEVSPKEDIPDEGKFNVEQKSWKEEAIKTLNILETEYGVNIYDPNNKPGMYLKKKGKSSQIIPVQLKEKFKENSLKSSTINKPNNGESAETPKNQLNNLFNHFKNNK